MDDLIKLETRMRELEARLIRSENEMGSIRSEFISLERQHRELSARLNSQTRPAQSQSIPTAAPAPQVPMQASVSPSPSTVSGQSATPARPASTQDVRPLAYQPPATPPPVGSAPAGQSLDRLIAKLKEKIGDIPVEEFVGMNLLNKIGILILVLGVSFFLKIAYDWIGPGLKVALLVCASAVVMGAGDYFYRRKNYVVFGLGLLSGGMVVLFFTAYASYNYDATRIIPEDMHFIGYAIQIILTGLMILATLRYDREAITSFAYFLSFLCVSINETGEFNHFSLAVIGLLAASLILIITIKRWKYLTGIGIFATYANFVLYSLSLPRGPDGYVLNDESNYFLFSLIYLSFYWVIFHVSVFSMKTDTRLEVGTGLTVNIANASAFLALVTYIRPEPTEWGGLAIFGTLGLVYVISAIVARKAKREHIWKSSIIIGTAFIALGLGLRFSGTSLILVWLIQATILVLCGYLFEEPYLRNLGYATFLLKIGAVFALPTAGAIYNGQDAWNLDLQLNHGSIYMAVILAALAIQIVSRPYKLSQIDIVAWHVLGIMLVVAVVLLSLFTISLPHQALLIAPAALALVILARLSSIRAHMAYGSILVGIAVLFSAAILVSGPGYKSNLNPLFVVCTLLGTSLVAFLFLLSPIQPEQLRQEIRNLENPWYIVATSNLFVALIATISLVENYAPPQTTALCLIPPALLLLFSDRRTEHGKLQFMGLCAFTFLLSLHQFQTAFIGDSASDRLTFLCNAVVLWCLTTGAYFVTAKYRESGVIAFCLTFTSSIEAVLILQQISQPALFPAAVAAYSLATLLVSGQFRASAIPALALNAFAFIMGPLRVTFSVADVTGWDARLGLGLICLFFLLSAIRSWLRESNMFINYFYYTAIAAIVLTIYSILPLEFHPTLFSVLAVIAISVVSRFCKQGMEHSWNILTVLSLISFIYMLVKMNLNPQFRPEWLKAILGALPLAFIAFSTRIYSESTRLSSPVAPGWNPRNDMFRKFVIFSIFLLLVALTMTLIDARYWSVAWAVEATALVLFGLMWRMAALRYTGMALIAIMLAKVAFWDLKNLEDTIRVAVLIAIGLLLVGASFLYARFKDRFMGEQNEKI
ncbi:MAG: DUF2339 domain-containing protein [Leptospirales bacterium]|nr:DUF2339 domain-containing protein [Leptospirales bacterium]